MIRKVYVKVWKCGNCGHETKGTTDNLKELGFQWLGPRTSKTVCQNCGSYTLQRVYDDTLQAGEFLLVRSFNGIKKGAPKCLIK